MTTFYVVAVADEFYSPSLIGIRMSDDLETAIRQAYRLAKQQRDRTQAKNPTLSLQLEDEDFVVEKVLKDRKFDAEEGLQLLAEEFSLDATISVTNKKKRAAKNGGPDE
jgi:hypothetical protein